MPFSYQGFGPAAILIMMTVLLYQRVYKKLKHRQQTSLINKTDQQLFHPQ